MDETNEPVAEISVQETNRLRESLGLKPLQIDAAAGAAETPEQNYANARAAQAETARQKLLAENLEKARNKRKLNALRAGSTLGDDDDQLSTQDWIKKVFLIPYSFCLSFCSILFLIILSLYFVSYLSALCCFLSCRDSLYFVACLILQVGSKRKIPQDAKNESPRKIGIDLA